jgi:hypothetical protein
VGGRGKEVTGEQLMVCGVWGAWEGGQCRAADGLWSVGGVGRRSLESY